MSYRADKLVIDARTDTHTRTHTQTQATTIQEAENWPRVKLKRFGNILLTLWWKENFHATSSGVIWKRFQEVPWIYERNVL